MAAQLCLSLIRILLLLLVGVVEVHRIHTLAVQALAVRALAVRALAAQALAAQDPATQAQVEQHLEILLAATILSQRINLDLARLVGSLVYSALTVVEAMEMAETAEAVAVAAEVLAMTDMAEALEAVEVLVHPTAILALLQTDRAAATVATHRLLMLVLALAEVLQALSMATVATEARTRMLVVIQVHLALAPIPIPARDFLRLGMVERKAVASPLMDRAFPTTAALIIAARLKVCRSAIPLSLLPVSQLLEHRGRKDRAPAYLDQRSPGQVQALEA